MKLLQNPVPKPGTISRPRRHSPIPMSIFLVIAIGALSYTSGLTEKTPTQSMQTPPFAPITDADFYNNANFADELVELGRLLFFDPILSGNRNIACATCHHPLFNTSDGLALPIGEGGEGLGPNRRVPAATPISTRIPRNSQALFFLGAREYTTLFHDGRLERDPATGWNSGFHSPARSQLPAGLDNVLAAQAMFPVISPAEMAGHEGENAVADAVARNQLAGPDGAWALIAARIADIPNYVARFKESFRHIETARDIRYTDIANAIAAFETVAFRADGSPFDHYLRTGDPGAMDPAARRGMALFYGEAGCVACHAGKLQTDHDFHAIAMPQIGPGKGDGTSHGYWDATGFTAQLEDYGRGRVTQRPGDRYRFRTPSLRNVALTAPYGHTGSFETLEGVVRHHLAAQQSLHRYQPPVDLLTPVAHWVEQTASGSQPVYQSVSEARRTDFERRDFWVAESEQLIEAIAAANTLQPVSLSNGQIADIIAFLQALTDPASAKALHLVPDSVPSGLPVDQLFPRTENIATASDNKSEATTNGLSLNFHFHLDAGMFEQDVFIHRPGDSSGVYRVMAGDRDLKAPLYRTATFVPHAPYDANKLGPYKPGKPLGITLGEWLSGEGRGSYTCTDGKGELDITFANLAPNGVYTLWQFFTADPPTEPFTGTLVLPVGARDGTESIFQADAHGSARYRQSFRPCLQMSGRQLATGLATAYHSDGQTYGPLPGEWATRSHVHMMLKLPKRTD